MTVTVAMKKGGSGKSLLSAHLALAAAERSETLAIDLDSQRNLLRFLGVENGNTLPALLSGYGTVGPETFVTPAAAANLRTIPSDESIVSVEALAMITQKPVTFLRDTLRSIWSGEFTVIDTPTAGYFSEMALVAADVVVAPVALRRGDVDVLPEFLERVEALNKSARIIVVPNRMDLRNNVGQDELGKLLDIVKRYEVGWGRCIPETIAFDVGRLNGRPIWQCRAEPYVISAMESLVKHVLGAGEMVPA